MSTAPADEMDEDSAAPETQRGRVRPRTAEQSWYATLVYVFGFELLHAFNVTSVGANLEIALLLLSPAGAYLGLRTWDKHQEAKVAISGGKP